MLVKLLDGLFGGLLLRQSHLKVFPIQKYALVASTRLVMLVTSLSLVLMLMRAKNLVTSCGVAYILCELDKLMFGSWYSCYDVKISTYVYMYVYVFYPTMKLFEYQRGFISCNMPLKIC